MKIKLKIMRLILMFIFITFSKVIFADQLVYVTKEQCLKFYKELILEDYIIYYCPFCEDSEPETIKIESIEIPVDSNRIKIIGFGKNSKKFCSVVDLAYIYVKIENKAVKLANKLNISSIGKTEFKWIDRPAESEYWHSLRKVNQCKISTIHEDFLFDIQTLDSNHYKLHSRGDFVSFKIGSFLEIDYALNTITMVGTAYIKELDVQMTKTLIDVKKDDLIKIMETRFINHFLKLEIYDEELVLSNYDVTLPYKGVGITLIDGSQYFETKFGWYLSNLQTGQHIMLSNLRYKVQNCDGSTTIYEIDSLGFRLI